jgi:hypothetical protein
VNASTAKPSNARTRKLHWQATHARRRLRRVHAHHQHSETGYLESTRQPLASLAFLLPLLAAYEAGALWLEHHNLGHRTGADQWLHAGLDATGLALGWLPPTLLVVSLLVWQLCGEFPWRFRASAPVFMTAESGGYALGLVGLSRVVDLGFAGLEQGASLLQAAAPAASAATSTSSEFLSRSVAPLVGYLGAGIYEEALFRLALLPVLYGLTRLIQIPEILAGTVAVTGSALLFSLAHHLGAPGETFSWFVFIFRWLAGIYFAWIFLVRGIGVAVGAHVAYDVLVGWLGASLG